MEADGLPLKGAPYKRIRGGLKLLHSTVQNVCLMEENYR